MEVQKQIERLSGNSEELCKGLQHVIDLDVVWPYEKADLLHWAKVLDILDIVLGKEDSPEALLIVSLKFTRMLLENCSNRHVYNSYEVRACPMVLRCSRGSAPVLLPEPPSFSRN